MSGTLQSPGVQVTITDQSFYNSAGPGTVPLFVIATAANKTAGSGSGSAASTLAGASPLYLATSQSDLVAQFGNPNFYSVQGTPVQGYELNEYGLWAAYSYLGFNNRAYILRADVDLSAFSPSITAPTGPPVAGTYWLNLSLTRWGIFQANGSSVPGSAWTSITPLIALPSNVDEDNLPLSDFGQNGNICVVPLTASNLFYEKIGGTWYQIGVTNWKTQRPTVITGTTSPGSVPSSDAISINGTVVNLTGGTLGSVAASITSATIQNITAAVTNNVLVVTNTAGGSITLANSVGTPLTVLGLPSGVTPGVTMTFTNDASYPSGIASGSIWFKGTSPNFGAKWAVEFYSSTGTWTTLQAPFYQFTSTVSDGTNGKDAAAVSAMPQPSIGAVYIGYDPASGVQAVRRWNGTAWAALTYEASVTAPVTEPADGSYWFNSNLQADIMVSDGVNWRGYTNVYSECDPKGAQISASAPLTQSDGTALASNDLWIDSSNSENYPVINRWNDSTQTWQPIDNTDSTTPFGIVFADARSTSGQTYTGISESASYSFGSVAISDLVQSDFVDPDAPYANAHASGCLLFNTRYSTNNVKQWNTGWFLPGGFDPNTDYTQTSYTFGNYTFPAVSDPTTWVTASGNQTNGAPWMGRKAQRIMVVTALQAVVQSNQDIRSELVNFNLMAAPGYPEMLGDLMTLDIDMGETAFIVTDAPIRMLPTGNAIQAWAGNSAGAPNGELGLSTHYDNAAVYYPWGLGTNTDGTEIMVPPSAIALATMAYNDSVAYPWYAPAGFTRGLVLNASTVGYLSSNGSFTPTLLNQGQRDTLYTNSVNPIAFIPGRGLVVYGQITLYGQNSALNRINVARLCCYLRYQLAQIVKPFLFEQNTAQTRLSAGNTVASFLTTLVGLNAVGDFAVVCDTSNNTPETIDAEQLWINVAVQPVHAIEFIYVPVVIQQTGAATTASTANLTG